MFSKYLHILKCIETDNHVPIRVKEMMIKRSATLGIEIYSNHVSKTTLLLMKRRDLGYPDCSAKPLFA